MFIFVVAFVLSLPCSVFSGVWIIIVKTTQQISYVCLFSDMFTWNLGSHWTDFH